MTRFVDLDGPAWRYALGNRGSMRRFAGAERYWSFVTPEAVGLTLGCLRKSSSAPIRGSPRSFPSCFDRW